MFHGHFLAVSAALIALAVVLAVGILGYDLVVSRVYAATCTALGQSLYLPADATTATTEGPTLKANREELLNVAREGARWANRNHSEVVVWSIILLVVAFIVGGYHLWSFYKQ